MRKFLLTLFALMVPALASAQLQVPRTSGSGSGSGGNVEITDGNAAGEADVLNSTPVGTEWGLVVRCIGCAVSTSTQAIDSVQGGFVTNAGMEITADLKSALTQGNVQPLFGSPEGLLKVETAGFNERNIASSGALTAVGNTVTAITISRQSTVMFILGASTSPAFTGVSVEFFYGTTLGGPFVPIAAWPYAGGAAVTSTALVDNSASYWVAAIPPDVGGSGSFRVRLSAITSGQLDVLLKPATVPYPPQSTITIPPITFASPQAVTAVNLDIRDLVFTTDKVDVSGSAVTIPPITFASPQAVTQSGVWTVQQGTPPWSGKILDGGAAGEADVVNALPASSAYGVVVRTPAPGYDSGLIINLPAVLTTVTASTIRLRGIVIINKSGGGRRFTVTNLAGDVYVENMNVPAQTTVFVEMGNVTVVGVRWFQSSGAANSLNGQVVGEQ